MEPPGAPGRSLWAAARVHRLLPAAPGARNRVPQPLPPPPPPRSARWPTAHLPGRAPTHRLHGGTARAVPPGDRAGERGARGSGGAAAPFPRLPRVPPAASDPEALPTRCSPAPGLRSRVSARWLGPWLWCSPTPRPDRGSCLTWHPNYPLLTLPGKPLAPCYRSPPFLNADPSGLSDMGTAL